MALLVADGFPIPLALVPSSLPGRRRVQASAQQQGFRYARASPAVRWPHRQEKLQTQELEEQGNKDGSHREDPYVRLDRLAALVKKKKKEAELDGQADGKEAEQDEIDGFDPLPARSESVASPRKQKRNKMSRLALLKAADWRERVERLRDAVCSLSSTDPVADLLNQWPEQLAPSDYSLLVKQVGLTHWQRALELFEWLNLKHWYTPNNRMLSAILGILGRSNQVNLAEEIFQRVEPELGDCVQVFNAILGVHARHGNWERMQTILKMMLEKGCERDLFTYNTLVSGRGKAGLRPGMAMQLLREIWQAGLRPDTVTYNTLISVCCRNECYEDAVLIFEEMKEQKCRADVWTYNSMISVYGRCGSDGVAEEVYFGMIDKGFSPDAITYNSILFAYAKAGRLEDVERVRKDMQEAGCKEDMITKNTLIDMYAKNNMHEEALAIYEQVKAGTRNPDGVTYIVLIDGLGKAGRVQEAECLFKEMRETNLMPSVGIFCAMIGAYAKAALYGKAANVYQDMLKAGIQPDQRAYAVMLDVFINLRQARNVLSVYNCMMPQCRPGLVQSGRMLQLFQRDGMEAEVEALSEQVLHFGFKPLDLCTIFAKVGLCDAAERSFLTALSEGQTADSTTFDLLLNCFAKANRLDDARLLVHSMSSPGREGLHEQLILFLANSEKFEEANQEMVKLKASGKSPGRTIFRTLIVAYELAGMPLESVQMLEDMQSLGLSPDAVCYRSALLAYCRSGLPDDGHVLLQKMKAECGGVKDAALYVTVAKSYIKLKEWTKSETALNELKEAGLSVALKDYEALLRAYAQHAQAQQIQSLLMRMGEDGFRPSPGFSEDLLQALFCNGRLVEVNEVYNTLQDLRAELSMQTHARMISAYAKDGNVDKASSLYERLRSSGFILQVEVFNVLIGMFSKAGSVDDAERVMTDMTDSGYQPNIVCYNAMLSVYSKARNFKKAALVFQGMQACGFMPDTVTYNTLIHLYSRCLHIQEAYALLQQMKEASCAPDRASYILLLTACGKMRMWEFAEDLFKEMQNSGIETDEATYHLMIDIYRQACRPDLTQDIVTQMKEHGFEPSFATMHMLMDSYGKGGQAKGAESVFDGMVEAGLDLGVSQYTSLVDAYLKEGDYGTAISKLENMSKEGITANYVTWTCVSAAASKCERREDALNLLQAMRGIGFSIPYKLLIGEDSLVLLELECLTDELQDENPGGAAGLYNVLLDLLWAFHKRATAAQVFLMAVKKKVYVHEITRVNESDWAANLCRLSPGAGLVALMLWLTAMQEAALQGSPRSSKFVLLIIGSSKRSNNVSLSRTIKSFLWEMGAPFLLSKTREGTLISKGHSVEMWLKDSPKCIDLELENRTRLPELNSMDIYQGAWIPRHMVPTFKQIEETMGTNLRPRKFMKFVDMPEVKRADVMLADIKGRAEKLAKDKARREKVKFTLPVRTRPPVA